MTSPSLWIRPSTSSVFSVAADVSPNPNPRLRPAALPSARNPDALAQTQNESYSQTPRPQSRLPSEVAGSTRVVVAPTRIVPSTGMALIFRL